MRPIALFLSFAGIFMIPSLLFSQKQDTTKTRGDTTKTGQIIQDIKDSKISKQIMKSITRSNTSDPTAAVKSEEAFMPYEGKIIREILIRHISFQRTVYDTTKSIRNTVTKLGDKLHTTSKDWVIRDNLFIRENKPLNPFKLADNERHLRDLNFLLDAKFYVIPLRDAPDSVDLVVLTRDVFSLGGTVSPSPSRTRFRLYEANFAGQGQRLELNGVYDADRQPDFIYEFLYRKNSIGGTFIDATVGYTQLNTGSSYGEEDEKAYYVRLDRPLVSPYTRYAGGIELSRNWSENFFGKNDTLFLNYRYTVNDFWIGYNIGANSNNDRSRHFIAIRAFDQHFSRVPVQLSEQQKPLYNDQAYVLAAGTFFKQDFYTTRYIYGFGRTEDLPYGHRVSVMSGWTRHSGVVRPYVGLDAEKSFVTRTGEFYTAALRAGGFTNHGGVEDGVVLLSGSLISRLIPRGEFLFRTSITADYTRVFRQRTIMPLDINNDFGLQYFRADSLWGTKRFHIQTETIAFSPWQLLGFRFAPFAFGEMAMISGNERSIFYDKPYFGFGGGVRTRNENLIFGTIELRLVYYPRTTENISSFNLRLTSNLRIKYSAGFVRAPSFVRYN